MQRKCREMAFNLFKNLDGYGGTQGTTLMYDEEKKKKGTGRRSKPAPHLPFRVDIQSRLSPLFRHSSRSLEFLVISPVILWTQQCTLNTQKSSFAFRAGCRFEILDCELDLSFNLLAVFVNVMATAFITLVA